MNNTMLYVDTKTGTYGEAKDLRLVREANADEGRFDSKADSEIIETAEKFGVELIPLLPAKLQ